jgi:hypothetical protein
MDTRTGEVFKTSDEELLKRLKEDRGEFLKQIPKEYDGEVNEALGSKNYAKINMAKKTPLTSWAKKQTTATKKRNQKAKRKMSKASRKKNRK